MMRQRCLGWVGLSLMSAILGTSALSGCGSATNGRPESAEVGGSAGGRGGAPSGQPPAGMQFGLSVYEIITELDLEPDQLPGVRAVLERAEQDREALLEETRAQMQGGVDRSAMTDMRARMDEINNRVEEELSAILTDEQMTAYLGLLEREERKREDMRSQMGVRGGGRGSVPGGF